MKFFVEPKLDAELFSVEDVITVSVTTDTEEELPDLGGNIGSNCI